MADAQSKSKSKIVLVTGASAGIGKAAAAMLARDGYTVYTAARRTAPMEELKSLGCIPLQMDICRAEDIDATVSRIEQDHGRLDVLVNNAGMAINGAIEEMPIEEARRQFEVNLFGLAALTQRVLPGMRQQGRGTIVNVSSVAGKLHTPISGWYTATKFALEGLSDTLRVEVAPFGIDVVLIEPGAIATEFLDVAIGPMLQRSGEGPYKEMTHTIANALQKAQATGQMSPPEVIARAIHKAVAARRPKTRYVAGKYSSTLLMMRRLFSDRMFDRAMMNFAKRRT